MSDETQTNETTTTTGEETTDENSDNRDQPEAAGLIDKANQAAERLEAANKKTEELIRRQEQLAAKQMLAGRSEAGQTQPQKTPEEMAEQKARETLANYY